MKCDINSDMFDDAIRNQCDCCHSDDTDLRSFGWGRVEINACETCFNDIRKRLNFGLKNQHAFHESEWLQERSKITA